MGASGSAGLKINFNRPNLFYFAGETVQGDVIFESSQDRLTVDAIYLECIGDASFRVEKERTVERSGRRVSETYSETVTQKIMHIRLPIAQPQYGQVIQIVRFFKIVAKFLYFRTKLLSIVVNIRGHFNFNYQILYLQHWQKFDQVLRLLDIMFVLLLINHGINQMLNSIII